MSGSRIMLLGMIQEIAGSCYINPESFIKKNENHLGHLQVEPCSLAVFLHSGQSASVSRVIHAPFR